MFSKDTWLLPQVRLVISSSFTHRRFSKFEKTGTAVMFLTSDKVESGFPANLLARKRACIFS